MGVDVHVDIVGVEQRIGALAKVEIVSVEVGPHLVDVSKRRARTGRCSQHSAVGVGSLIECSNLCVRMISRGVMSFVHNEKVDFRQIDDATHRIVSNHLRCGHDHRRLFPEDLPFVWTRIARVGYDGFLVDVEVLYGHASLLVDQTRGGCDKDDLLTSSSEKFCHGHPFDGSFSKTRRHHHQTGKGKNTFEGAKLVASCFNPIAQQRMDNMRHEIHLRSRVQKDDVGCFLQG